MKLSLFKSKLEGLSELRFRLPNGEFVPVHFHVTEVGQIEKHFIDCGGTVRKETTVNFQLWEAYDFDHRLAPQKLRDIIALSEKTLNLKDSEIEVEYQGDTIGKYGVSFENGTFNLLSLSTNCLASDKCGIPPQKQKVKLSDLSGAAGNSCCTPNGSCC
ncbi:MAG: DUF6428 family protein [Flavobacteriales bacterium]